MRRLFAVPLMLFCAVFSSAQEKLLCPKHIEIPVFPAIARTAHVMGDVVVKVTIGVSGNVTDAEAIGGPKLLQRVSVENARHWTFAPAPSEGFTQTITYTYQLDPNLQENSDTKVEFDLPGHVTLSTYVMTIQPQNSSH
jgi:TonB family protein